MRVKCSQRCSRAADCRSIAITARAYVTAGQYDIIVELVAADRRELLELTNRIRALEGVVSTETFLYLDMVKQLYDWGTRVPEEVR